jgi:membrane protein DedA with SNARE-associated domain/membrane-associated phospholipid phosphatase
VKLPESRRRRIGLLLAVVAFITVYYFVSRAVPHDDLQELLEDIANALGAWTYLLVGAFAFLETGAFVGLVVPGETIMLLGGAVAGQGAVDVYVLMGIAWFSAWAGDTTSFFLGRHLGRAFVLRRGPRVGITRERFERTERYFDRHGGKTILIGRFISLVRALAPFIAGSSGMRYRAFVPYSVLGTGIWSILHILIGYFFSRSIETAARYAGRGFFILGTLIALIVGGVLLYRYLREPENRRKVVAWMEERRATAWMPALGRRVRPQARFIWNRVTPGATFGLEFTSLMAVLSVAVFVLISFTVAISGDPGPTSGDQTAQDIVADLSAGWLVDVSKVVTDLGSGAVTWTLALVCVIALGATRRWPEMFVVAAAMLITVIGVHELKVATDRPRPTGGLVDAGGSAFPSGHAAYSTIYVWLAVAIVLRLRPGIPRGALLILAGVLISGLVGLSRVYLGVHYMSDVNAGWALGATAFSLCAAVGLVVTALRQNQRRVRRVEPRAGG